MAFHRVGARDLAGTHPVGDVAPVIRRHRAGSIPAASTASIWRRTCSTFGQLSIFNRISPPGCTKGSVW